MTNKIERRVIPNDDASQRQHSSETAKKVQSAETAANKIIKPQNPPTEKK